MRAERDSDIPYVFARKFGVVLLDDGAVGLREGSDPRVLIEVRRHLARSFAVTPVTPVEFDRRLSERYAMDGAAAAMAGEMGEAGELDLLAGDLPSAEDLLDSADDAPAIRLINGIIAEAVRHGVSDIHVEPYE
ncbi:MAG: type II secretion system protein GspE, partial [Pseudomonadota bacterium]